MYFSRLLLLRGWRENILKELDSQNVRYLNLSICCSKLTFWLMDIFRLTFVCLLSARVISYKIINALSDGIILLIFFYCIPAHRDPNPFSGMPWSGFSSSCSMTHLSAWTVTVIVGHNNYSDGRNPGLNIRHTFLCICLPYLLYKCQ